MKKYRSFRRILVWALFGLCTPAFANLWETSKREFHSETETHSVLFEEELDFSRVWHCDQYVDGDANPVAHERIKFFRFDAHTNFAVAARQVGNLQAEQLLGRPVCVQENSMTVGKCSNASRGVLALHLYGRGYAVRAAVPSDLDALRVISADGTLLIQRPRVLSSRSFVQSARNLSELTYLRCR